MWLACLALAGMVLCGCGCAHYPVNRPLSGTDARSGYRFHAQSSPTNSEELILVLAFSGGGTRAAALSYGVLEALARTTVTNQGNPHRLLDEVDVISSVSGGSFTAAYYALWGDRIFSDFESRFLKKNVEGALVRRELAPWNWFRLASSRFNRSDLAAEYYEGRLFAERNFGDLAAQPGRPFVVINATDIALGARFEFTQNQFDLIGSDLSSFSVARAVAASSAYPVVLSPVVLKNYAHELQIPEPAWVKSAFADPDASARRLNRAAEVRSYLSGDKRRFIHLLDGGLTDNLGLRGAIEEAIEHDTAWSTLHELHLESARRIAVIIVDAQVHHDFSLDSRDGALHMSEVVSSVTGVAISRYSFETIELFREHLRRLQSEAATAKPIDVYTIGLRFSQMPEESDRRFFNSIPTRFHLPSATVDRLRGLAATQLEANPEFRRLVGDLGGRPGSIRRD